MENFIHYLFHAGICFSVGYCIYLLLLQKETFFSLNRFILIFLVVISALFPFIDVQSPFRTNYLTYSRSMEAVSLHFPQRSLTIYDVLMIAYLSGVAVLSLRFLYQFFRLVAIIKRHGINKHRGINFVITDNEIPPFSFLNIAFIPKSLFFNDDFEQIVTHELVHIKQLHSIDLILMELFTIFQWFNPFVWSYRSLIVNLR